jgi:hypothetical protein
LTSTIAATTLIVGYGASGVGIAHSAQGNTLQQEDHPRVTAIVAIKNRGLRAAIDRVE